MIVQGVFRTGFATEEIPGHHLVKPRIGGNGTYQLAAVRVRKDFQRDSAAQEVIGDRERSFDDIVLGLPSGFALGSVFSSVGFS